MNVEKFISQHPGEKIEIMSPHGYIHLTPKACKELLEKKGVIADAGCSNITMRIKAEHILSQVVISQNCHNAARYIITE
jgi:hypothetical protein